MNKIYHKAAFDKRNARFEYDKAEPLESSRSLDGLGKSKEDALIVVVSSSGEDSSPTDILEAIRDLTLEIRENNKFRKKAAKKQFTLSKPKVYKSDIDNRLLQCLIHYGMVSPTTTVLPQDAFCHMLGTQVPLQYLDCTHVFQMRWHQHVRDFGLSNINCGKNILIFLKIFQPAFDTGRFVLVLDKQTGLIRCKIIDNELKREKLDEAIKDMFPNYQCGDVDFKGKICFGDLDGQELHFLNSERPYMHCLAFHAFVAREHALDYGWIDENELKELDNDDMWSDGSLDKKTKRFIDEWRVDFGSY